MPPVIAPGLGVPVDTLHVVLPLKSPHSHTVILLHGRDCEASEFAEDFLDTMAADGLCLMERFPTFKWVFPAARKLPSARFGGKMSQWFDMW